MQVILLLLLFFIFLFCEHRYRKAVSLSLDSIFRNISSASTTCRARCAQVYYFLFRRQAPKPAIIGLVSYDGKQL
ncbi:hypothetical protein GGR55DRAFT_658183 [Xylaria sp. FL0064]|nr:hypothetical protein GGR55DRAFT_658183 [Xylaria sp. FL0064]